eukprot:TRINITY_DN1402_c0_g2_i4.p1 TRINITY_DN1402_c0_g2~~TRINITY_DN1402_c0_g2_i4.p1  ORF type:complete len:372 (+),score=64.31 TRINITY_DN1402_c0_g2_i4:164-1279(+)
MYKNQASMMHLGMKRHGSSSHREHREHREPRETLGLDTSMIKSISRIEHDEKHKPESNSLDLLDGHFDSDEETSNNNKKHETILKLKEQLRTLQVKTKSFETVCDTQNSAFKMMTLANEKLSLDNKELENKYRSLKHDYERLQDTRNKDKLKIDAVITFCKFIESCRTTAPEMSLKFSELPTLISSFLTDQRENLSLFNMNSENSEEGHNSSMNSLMGKNNSNNSYDNMNAEIVELKNQVSKLQSNLSSSVGSGHHHAHHSHHSRENMHLLHPPSRHISHRSMERTPTGTTSHAGASRVRFDLPEHMHTEGDESTVDSTTPQKRLPSAFLRRAVWNSSNLLASIKGRSVYSNEDELRKSTGGPNIRDGKSN